LNDVVETEDRISFGQRLRSAAAGLPRAVGRFVLDSLYPPVCLACEAPLADADTLCGACFGKLRPITAPLCPRLGLPFAVSIGPGALSAEAIADPPPFESARSALVYNEVARTLVSRLKYGDRPELARYMARLMVQAGAGFWAERPLIVPVPLHPIRQFARRYNQSAELAAAIARLTGLRVDAALLKRTRRTRQQVGLTHDARARNVAGAFAAHPEALKRHGGRGVVLVDDVYTTGATLKAATRALKRAGVGRVDVLTFARVVTGGELPI
jgi:ComF family protein